MAEEEALSIQLADADPGSHGWQYHTSVACETYFRRIVMKLRSIRIDEAVLRSQSGRQSACVLTIVPRDAVLQVFNERL